MAPFSAFVTIVLLILSRQVFTYIPSHVQVWQPGIIYAGTNPTSFYWGYDKFTAAPQNVFLKLGGFYPVTQNMLDIRLEVALYSTYIRIDVFKGPIMDFSQVEFGILMTNDVGVVTVNSYNLTTHPGWGNFSKSPGARNLTYNISYSPIDPSLYQTGMTAVLSIRRINCSNFVDDMNVDLNVVKISTDWITFNLTTDGSTIFYDLLVDILIISQAFRDTHGMIQTSIRRQTDPRLKTTIYGTQKAENLFYNLQNENYTSRPVQLFIVQGFNISSAYPNIMVTTTPSLDFNDILSVNVYIRAIHGPINSINIEILTLCTKIDNCLTPQTLPDIESEFSIQYYSGIKSIGDFVGGNATMNYTFKTFLSQPPKYLLSGVTNGLVTGYDSIFGFSLLNYSKRGYSILLEAGALSPITWGYIFYFYSNWDGLQFHKISFNMHSQFSSVFGVNNGLMIRSLTYNLAYFACPELIGQVKAYVFFTKWVCTNSPPTFGLNQTFISANGTHARFTVNLLGICNLVALEGFLIIHAVESISYNVESFAQLLTDPPHPILSSLPYTSTQTTNRYPADYSIIFFIGEYHIDTTAQKLFAFGPASQTLINMQLNCSWVGYFSSNTYSAMGYIFTYVNLPRLLTIDKDIGPTINPVTPKPVVLRANFTEKKFGLLVTYMASYNGSSFIFQNTAINTLRIFQYKMFQALSTLSGTADFGPIDLPAPVNLTLWAVQLNVSSYWVINCYLNLNIEDILNYTPDRYLVSYFDYNQSPLKSDPNDYRSIQAITTLGHNATSDCTCIVKVNFNGILRVLYFNEEYILGGSSIHPESNITLQSSTKITLIANGLIYVTAIGYKLYINQISLENCTDSLTFTPVVVVLSQYLITSLYTSYNIQYAFVNVPMAPSCYVTKNSSVCYQCFPGLVLFKGGCSVSCLDQTASYPTIGKYCDAQFRSRVFRNSSSPNYDPFIGYSDLYTLDWDISAPIITLYEPFDLPFKKLTYLNDPVSSSSLVEASLKIGNLSQDKTLNISNQLVIPFQSSNPYALVMIFIGMKDYFVTSKYNTLNPLFAKDVYLPLSSPNVIVGSLKNLKVNFVLVSTTGCFLTIFYNSSETSGHLNHRNNIFFDNNITNTGKYYTFVRPFYGINWITLTLLNFTSFNLSLSGDCQIYAPDQLMHFEYLNISGTNNCSIPNCITCLSNNECLSCSVGFYLDPINKLCFSDCEMVYQPIPLEGICYCNQSDCSMSLQLTIINNSFCDGLFIMSSINPPQINVSSFAWNITDLTNGTNQIFGLALNTANLSLTPNDLIPGVLYNISLVVTTTHGNIITNYTQNIFTPPFEVSPPTGVYIVHYNQDKLIDIKLTSYCDYNGINIITNPILPLGSTITVFQNFTEIQMNACSLSPSLFVPVNIIFSFGAYYNSFFMELQTTQINFIALITNGDKMISTSLITTLTAFTSIIMPCPQDLLEGFFFSWSCIDLGTQLPCSLPPTTLNASNLTIPGSTFGSGQKIKFYLSLTVRNQTKMVVSFMIYDTTKILMVDFNCSQNYFGVCFISNQQIPIKLTALIQLQSLSELNYQWSFPTVPGISSYSFQNEFKIIITQSPVVESIRVNVTVSNLTHQGFASQIVLLSLAPINGSFAIYPRFGIAYETLFAFDAPEWYDLDLPLSYSFSYNLNQDWRKIVGMQPNSTVFSCLPYVIDLFGNISLKMEVYDVFGSKTEKFDSIGLTLNSSRLKADLEGLFLKYNETGDINILQMISVFLQSNFSSTLGQSEILNDKMRIINSLEDILSGNKTIDYTTFYNIINDLTSNTSELNVTVASKIFNLLKNQTSVGYSDFSQATSVSNIINNLYQYITQTDCSLSTVLGQKINNESISILENVVSSLQNGMITNENASVISTTSFDIYARKVSDCELINSIVSTSTLAPAVRMKYNNISQTCQNQTILFSYFAFSQNLFKCNSSEANLKTDISLKMTVVGSTLDSKTILKQFYAVLTMPTGSSCLAACAVEAGICVCKQLDIFDLPGQISNLFRNSNFKHLNNVSALRNWKFWEDPVFWVLVGLTLTFLVCDVVIRKYFLYTCWISTYTGTKSRFKILFWTSHPFVGAFISMTPELSKRKRNLVYFCRMVSMIAFAAFFKTKENTSSSLLINPYMILLPYLTFIPIYSVLQILIETPNIKRNPHNLEIPIKNYKPLVGFFILIIITLAWMTFMMIIAANQQLEEKIIWVIQFTQILAQDSLLSPLIAIVLQYCLFKLTRSNMIKRYPKLRKSLKKGLSYPFVEIVVRSSTTKLRINRTKKKLSWDNLH